MRKEKISKIRLRLLRWISPIVDPSAVIRGPFRYADYLKDWIKYSKMGGAEPTKVLNSYPCIHDKTKTSGFASHYFYQDIWAFKRIYESKVAHHLDVGSRVDFVGFLATVTNVTFIDIRPLEAKLDGLECKKGNILSLPYEDNSLQSLSCLHVAEHIGLGRYGDPLDPFGTKEAAKELSRVLAVNGNQYFSVPVGKPRLCFKAHRIHSPRQIINYFQDLNLVEFSGIDDQEAFKRNIGINALKNANYACGLFWFKKEA